ncbi:MAG: hypothetical protein JW759_00955 [Candidatus Coatesbacteria bacterium]|nr:hypothetical protein [Candidatus Coatesbacteria bacterium]
MRIGKKIISALLCAAIAILGAEAILQAVCLVFPRVDFVLSQAAGNQVPNVVEDAKIGFRPSAAHPDHDRNGFRNASVPDKADVVALGDSQTYGTGIPRKHAWPQQLARLSGLSLYNMSFGGFGPPHSLGLMDEALALKPSVILEALYSGNDLYDAYSLVHYRGKLDHLGSTDDARLQAIAAAEKREPLQKRIKRVYSMPDTTKANNPPRKHSRLVKALKKYSKLNGLFCAAYLMATRPSKPPVSAERVGRTFSLAEWEHQLAHARRNSSRCLVYDGPKFKTLLTPLHRLAALDLADPRIAEGMSICARAIAEMNDKTKSAGIGFAVLLIPTKEFVFRYLVYANSKSIPRVYSELIRNEAAFWRMTKEFLDSQSIPYIDVEPILRGCLDRDIQPYDITTDGHPNASGHLAIAEHLAEIVQNSGLRTRQD